MPSFRDPTKSREPIPRPVCYHIVSMIRMPKTLVALVMTFALFVQASAGCACAISCLTTASGSHSETSHHQDAKTDGDCCDQDKHPDSDNHHGLGHDQGSGPHEKCGCPTVSSCDSDVPPSITANLSFAPTFDFVAVLPEPLELNIQPNQNQNPGYFGNDSGPPLRVPPAFCSPRAPPVA